MSNTPRTDIVESEFVGYYDLAEHVRLENMTEHARELERELAAEKARNKELEQDRDMWRDRVLDVEDTLKDERAAHLEAQKALVVANRGFRMFLNAQQYDKWQKKFGALVEVAREAVEKSKNT